MTPLILMILGLCAGSFVNAIVWRIHQQTLSKSKRAKSKKASQLSIVNGRSICVNCYHQLAWYDLIPVISWISLKGKCRYCHKPISLQYPIVELSTAILFLISYAHWPLSLSGLGLFDFIVWLIMLTGLMALTIYDLKWTILPNRIIYPLSGMAFLTILIEASFFQGGLTQIEQSIWALLIGGGIFYLLFQISSGKWIGGGDVKLGALLGLIVGKPTNSLLFIVAASLLGSLITLPLLLSHRLKASSKIPFGPLLITGAIIAKLFGVVIVNWYTRQFLFITRT
ncbi:MAG TPA: prepilin peptidase [Candidatus Saccharimonadales bacterium]|nr:prepilin peptidase [Candidatus Saccharimonadales bacterium]